MFNINNLNEDYFIKLSAEEILEIKELTTENKIKCFKFFLENNVITNKSVIGNIFMLINGINSFEDDLAGDNRIFFNGLEEYVDIKTELREEISAFKIKLLEYYLGIIKGLTVKLPELKVHITNTYYNIFQLANPIFISKLMVTHLKYVDNAKIQPTFNAESIYDKINGHVYSHTFGIIQRILSEASDENIGIM